MITATLQRAWTDISGFLVVMTIMFLAYSIAVRSFPRLTSTCCWSPCFSLCFMFTLWNRSHLKVVTDTEVNFLFSSLTWCMAGSCTPIGLCLMPCRPWSACSLVFLTMKRSVWDNHNSTTAHICCSSSFTIVLASGPTGTELQSSARCFPHRVLHRVYDLCGAEPLHLRHSGGIHSGADTSQGNSPTPGRNAADVNVQFQYRPDC